MDALSMIDVTPLPGSVADAVVWRNRGQLHVTVLAKASFAFVPDADMMAAEPQPIVASEVHHGNSPARSVRLTSDRVPYLGRADVLFTGHAYAPPEGPIEARNVRLAILGPEGVLLDKRLVARNGRGFQWMPIVYERAFSGLDLRDNPLGVDADAANVIDPNDPSRPAGSGPIASAWPARKRLLGTLPRKALDAAIVEIPEPFEWTYFQAAPLDQQIGYLRGDEWIVLEGLHRTLARIRTRLPNVRGEARIHGLAASGVPNGHRLELRADTLRIDGDEERCTVVWRQSFPISGEAALRQVRVVAGVERAETPLIWPAPPSERRSRQPPSLGAPRPFGPQGTQVLGSDERRDATQAFSEDMPATERPPHPFVAAPSVPAPTPTLEHVTFALSGDEERTAVLALPFTHRPGASPLDEPAHAARPPTPLPGSPWSSERAAHVPLSLDGVPTLGLFDDLAVKPPEPPRMYPIRDPVREIAPPPMPSRAAPPSEGTKPPEELGLRQCAAIAAELMELRVARGDVLGAHGLSEASWADAEKRWSGALAEEASYGGRALLDEHDDAYLARWEAIRGPFSVDDDAALTHAARSGSLTTALDAMGVRRTTWMRLKRVFSRRIAAEPAFAARVQRALQEHR